MLVSIHPVNRNSSFAHSTTCCSNEVGEQPYPDGTAHMYHDRQPVKQGDDRLTAQAWSRKTFQQREAKVYLGFEIREENPFSVCIYVLRNFDVGLLWIFSHLLCASFSISNYYNFVNQWLCVLVHVRERISYFKISEQIIRV